MKKFFTTTICLLFAALTMQVWGVETSYVLAPQGSSSITIMNNWSTSSPKKYTLTGPGSVLHFDYKTESLATGNINVYAYTSSDCSGSGTKLGNYGNTKNEWKNGIEINIDAKYRSIKFEAGGTVGKYIRNASVTRATTLATTTQTLSFDKIIVGQSSSKKISVSYNNTQYPQQITGTCTNSAFTITSTNAGETGTTDITITFRPTQVGEQKGTVTLTMNGVTTSFEVSGTGVTTYYFQSNAVAIGSEGNAFSGFSLNPTTASATSNISNTSNKSETKTVYFKAEETSSNIHFAGWYSDEQCTTRTSEVPEYTEEITSSETSSATPATKTRYAKFVSDLTPEITANYGSGTKEMKVGDEIANAYSFLNTDNPEITPSANITYDKESNTITALGDGPATITFHQSKKGYILEKTFVFNFNISKIANTLAIKPAETILVDGTITNVLSNKNSDGAITPSINIESISSVHQGDDVITYDADANTISAHNAGVAVLTLKQAETFKYEGKTLSIRVTVNKHDNTLYVDGQAGHKSYSLSYDEGTPVALTATNTDYVGSAFVVNQTAGDNLATYYPDQKAFYTSHYAGTASWTVTQPENYKYKATTATFDVTIGSIPETECTQVLQSSEYSINGYAGTKSFGPIDFEPKKLHIELRKQGAGTQGFTIKYAGNTIKNFANDEIPTSYTGFDFDLSAYPSGGKVEISSGGTLDKYFKNLYVTRKTYINADDVTFPNRFPNDDAAEANLVIDWSVSNGGDIRILCDNPKFTLEKAKIENTSCANRQTTIPVSYTSTEAGTDVANITIYNNVLRTTCKLTATTIKRQQTLNWWTTDTDPIIAVGETIEKAATTSANNITYTSSTPSVIEVVDGKLVARAAGEATITANDPGNEVYAAVDGTKKIIVTADLVQSIVWNQNLMNLKLGDGDVTLNAYATSDVLDCTTNGSRKIDYYVSSNTDVVEVVNYNQLRIVGVGTTHLTAMQAGGLDADGHTYAPVSSVKRVIVRDPQAQCENDIYDQTNEWSVDLGWNSATHQTKTSEISFVGGEPADYEFDYKGEPHTVGFQYYNGEMYVDEYYNGSWHEIKNLGEPKKGTYQTARGTLSRQATKMRIRVEGKSGYFYYTNLRVGLARYIESSENSLSYATMVGSSVTKTVTVRYSNIQGPLTISSTNPLYTISKTYIDGDCGAIGSFNLNITYTPTQATAGASDLATITVTDGKSTPLKIELSGEANVTNRAIEWDHADETNIYTIQTETLSAAAYTTDGYHLEAGSVVFAINATSTAEAAISADNILSFASAGDVIVLAQTVADPRYNPAPTVSKVWHVALTPTATTTKPTCAAVELHDVHSLADISLIGGEAKNTYNNEACAGTYTWENPAIVPQEGEHSYTVVFTPNEPALYATHTLSVNVVATYELEVFPGDEHSEKIDYQNWDTYLSQKPNALAVVPNDAPQSLKEWAQTNPNVLLQGEDGTYTCIEFAPFDFSVTAGGSANSQDLYVPEDFVAERLVYDRQFIQGYNSLCVPFALTKEQLGCTRLFILGPDGYDPETNVITFTDAPGDRVEAGEACVAYFDYEPAQSHIELTDADVHVQMVNDPSQASMLGVYAKNSDYGYKNAAGEVVRTTPVAYSIKSDGTKFVKLTTWIYPFRAVLYCGNGFLAAPRMTFAAPSYQLPTDVEKSIEAERVSKKLVNGVIYIVRGGRTYDANGRLLR